MRPLFIALISLITITTATAQISLEHQYVEGASLVQVAPGEWNYYMNDSSTLYIYDVNHSLIRSIPIPDTVNSMSILWLSKGLFDTDASYEYMLTYYNGTNHVLKIYNEAGTQLYQTINGINGGIYNTNSGTKMLLHEYINGIYSSTQVYSLPGTLLKVATQSAPDMLGNPYPNPGAGLIRLPYQLPKGESGSLYLYDNSGREVRRFEIGPAFDELLLDATGLPAGAYFLSCGAGLCAFCPEDFNRTLRL